jgi:hypothetical protein
MEKMFRSQPELLDLIDGWTSHSYPNPGFSSSPYANAKNTMRGFEFELLKLKTMTGKLFPVYITETGWDQSAGVGRSLANYYKYTAASIWSNPQVKAVTVFLLKGTDGPYAGFSLLNSDNTPTVQMRAFQAIMKGKK